MAAVESVAEAVAGAIVGHRCPFEDEAHQLEPLRVAVSGEFGTFGFELLSQRGERDIDEVDQGANSHVEGFLECDRIG